MFKTCTYFKNLLIIILFYFRFENYVKYYFEFIKAVISIYTYILETGTTNSDQLFARQRKAVCNRFL